MMRIWQTALAILAVITAGTAAAAEGPKPLFAATDIIHLTIKGAIPSLAEGTKSDKHIDATLTVDGAAPETLAVTLSARGITRRRHEICPFPPLRVEFPEKPGAASLFKGQKKLKLVTHCKPSAAFQQYLLLEYAAYKMFNLLTPQSFDVRLASIDYVDAGGKPLTSRLGFFIEDTADMAKRNGLKEFKTQDRVLVAKLNPPAAARFAVFADMIGNLDWAMTAGPKGTDCCHNSRLLGAEAATAVFTPVPYDFDFAGMVDAPYAMPPEGIPVDNVRVRLYRGYCRHNAEAQTVAADLLARRAEIFGVLDAIPQLEERTRRKAAAYLGGFFDPLSGPGGTANLVKTCL